MCKVSDFQLVQKFTVAHLNWEGDGIQALYEGDSLLFAGDQYHDKIGEYIDGFFAGLDHAGYDYGKEDIYVSGEHFEDTEAPPTLDGLKDEYPWTESV